LGAVTAIFDGDVSLVIMLDLQTRVGMKPPDA